MTDEINCDEMMKELNAAHESDRYRLWKLDELRSYHVTEVKLIDKIKPLRSEITQGNDLILGPMLPGGPYTFWLCKSVMLVKLIEKLSVVNLGKKTKRLVYGDLYPTIELLTVSESDIIQGNNLLAYKAQSMMWYATRHCGGSIALKLLLVTLTCVTNNVEDSVELLYSRFLSIVTRGWTAEQRLCVTTIQGYTQFMEKLGSTTRIAATNFTKVISEWMSLGSTFPSVKPQVYTPQVLSLLLSGIKKPQLCFLPAFLATNDASTGEAFSTVLRYCASWVRIKKELPENGLKVLSLPSISITTIQNSASLSLDSTWESFIENYQPDVQSIEDDSSDTETLSETSVEQVSNSPPAIPSTSHHPVISEPPIQNLNALARFQNWLQEQGVNNPELIFPFKQQDDDTIFKALKVAFTLGQASMIRVDQPTPKKEVKISTEQPVRGRLPSRSSSLVRRSTSRSEKPITNTHINMLNTAWESGTLTFSEEELKQDHCPIIQEARSLIRSSGETAYGFYTLAGFEPKKTLRNVWELRSQWEAKFRSLYEKIHPIEFNWGLMPWTDLYYLCVKFRVSKRNLDTLTNLLVSYYISKMKFTNSPQNVRYSGLKAIYDDYTISALF
ncbi:MAG: phosphoprotein [Wufeng shrew rhabdovirus 5]|nr:MAG: phosphoprotein [Wufeng shrew rhabdovirus 5]